MEENLNLEPQEMEQEIPENEEIDNSYSVLENEPEVEEEIPEDQVELPKTNVNMQAQKGFTPINLYQEELPDINKMWEDEYNSPRNAYERHKINEQFSRGEIDENDRNIKLNLLDGVIKAETQREWAKEYRRSQEMKKHFQSIEMQRYPLEFQDIYKDVLSKGVDHNSAKQVIDTIIERLNKNMTRQTQKPPMHVNTKSSNATKGYRLTEEDKKVAFMAGYSEKEFAEHMNIMKKEGRLK